MANSSIQIFLETVRILKIEMTMSKNINIELLVPDQIDNVLSLSQRLNIDSIPCSYWGLDSDRVSELIDRPNRTRVALKKNVLVGIGTVSQGNLYQRHLAEISVAVCPNYRQQGIAKMLISALEDDAKAIGVEMIKALIWTENLPSKQLFESLGYEHRTTLYAEFKSQDFGEMDSCVYYKRLAYRG
ncbi:MAG: GNAT family N-acetyltransferase [Gemmatimonadetes bacterium]|nr:GNAT family N-acetyltransferase [Gemmatimonadota bacterium]MYK52651.1 GNAT family N-acetyltransferase [Gemmatimonadota bacterium]